MSKASPRFLNLCKVEMSNSVDFDNQAFNSRAAVFEKLPETSDSQNIVAYRPWSGRYAPCFSPTSPRFIRHRRRFGDVARSSKKAVKHCGVAIENLIVKVAKCDAIFTANS